MKYFNNIKTADELKNKYRELCLSLHPDRGGKEEDFKMMVAEYEQLKNQFINGGTSYKKESYTKHEETEEERKQRKEEERKRREEWARWEAEEKRRQEEEIRKAQEATRKTVAKWANILERVNTASDRKARYWSFKDNKEAAAFMAVTKRNIKKVINEYFPGLKVNVSLSGKIWGERFDISWEDGPTKKEVEAIKELYLFIPSYYASDPYADYGSYYDRQDNAPWREAYGQAMGDCTNIDFERTLSAEGMQQAEEKAAKFFANWNSEAKNGEEVIITYNELSKFMKDCGRGDKVCNYWEYCGHRTISANEKTFYYSQLRSLFKEYVKVDITPKEEAPKFTPKYGKTIKAILKALGTNVFCTMQETKRRENDWRPVFVSCLLGELSGVKICKPYGYDGETLYSPLYFTSYTAERNRVAKFAAVGITIKGSKVISITNELREALTKEINDAERQRKEWEKAQAEGTQTGKRYNYKAKTQKANTSEKKHENGDNTTDSPADGLRLIKIANGVAVVADDWKTTYFNKKSIAAHGAHWNKEAKRWEATETADIESLCKWFGIAYEESEAEANESTTQANESEAEANESTTQANESEAEANESEAEANESEQKPAYTDEEIKRICKALGDICGLLSEVFKCIKDMEGVTVPGATLERWREENENGTKSGAAQLCEMCACLASLTPEARKDFDALGVIFYTLSEQLKNGYNPAPLEMAINFAKSQFIKLLEDTQTKQQTEAIKKAMNTGGRAAA